MFFNARRQEEIDFGDLKLYSSKMCPNSQRVQIALLYKGIPFKYAKPLCPDMESPRTVPPILVHGNKELSDSSVVIEYIDEVYSGSSRLLPQDPFERAQARLWQKYVSDCLIPSVEAAVTCDQDKSQQGRLVKDLAKFVRAMVPKDEGNFFLGRELGLVDISFFPWALQIDLLRKSIDFDPVSRLSSAEATRYRSWYQANLQHPAVRATLDEEPKLLEAYRDGLNVEIVSSLS